MATSGAPDTIHLLCPTHNGAEFLPAFLASLQAQTHTDWMLWLLDDHSADQSPTLLQDAARHDSRFRVLTSPSSRLGAVGAFAHLWAQLPLDAPYVAFADQDDVWHPDKLAVTLVAMRQAEQSGEGGRMRPVLVHTDLEVVGPSLEPWAPSYWAHAGIVPDPVTLPRLVAQNVVTGCTMLMNRALVQEVGPIPAEATMHDAWVACVAAAMGHIVTLPRPTVQYRQHGANTLGARQAVDARPFAQRITRFWHAFSNPEPVRRQIGATARQAALLLQHHGPRLADTDRDFLRVYAQIPTMSWWRRKNAVARLHLHREHSVLRNAGILWRA